MLRFEKLHIFKEENLKSGQKSTVKHQKNKCPYIPNKEAK